MQNKNVMIVISLLLVLTLIIGCIKPKEQKEQETRELETTTVKPTVMVEKTMIPNPTISNITTEEEVAVLTRDTNETIVEEVISDTTVVEEVVPDTIVVEEVVPDTTVVEEQNMEDRYDVSYIFKVDDENVMLDRNVRLIELATEEGMAIISVDGGQYRLIYNIEQEIKDRIIKIADLDGDNQTVKIMARYNATGRI